MTHPLEAYADSYAQMARHGDGRVDCRSVEVDIRQNMIPATRAISDGEAVEPVAFDLESLLRSMGGIDHNQPGYQHRKGWNDAIRHVMDLRRATQPASPPDQSDAAVTDMLRTAKELRDNANGDCGSIEQAIRWEKKAAARATEGGQNDER